MSIILRLVKMSLCKLSEHLIFSHEVNSEKWVGKQSKHGLLPLTINLQVVSLDI